MSSRAWNEVDGAFCYRTFYYSIIDLLRENWDWFHDLQRHWNLYVVANSGITTKRLNHITGKYFRMRGDGLMALTTIRVIAV